MPHDLKDFVMQSKTLKETTNTMPSLSKWINLTFQAAKPIVLARNILRYQNNFIK